MNLADYERRKFELAEILRAIVVASPKGPSGLDAPFQALFARLAEDRFNLAVVGRFSRGKSSLMNAILGLDRLPTGIVPLTSVITSIGYGSEECVELRFEGRSLTTKIKLEALPRYVTQEGNPGNQEQVELAEVQLPAEILRRGFYFVDTPGLGSTTLANTRTTEAFLPAADAFLLVTSYDGPLSEDELRLLRMTEPTGRRVFVAINKLDTVEPAAREQAEAYVRGELRCLLEGRTPAVFSTSATLGLTAKQTNDAALLAASGVDVLERALVDFLVNEKSRAFLLQTCVRIEDLTSGVSSADERERLRQRLGRFRSALGVPAGSAPRRSVVGGLAPTASEAAGACQICRAIEEATFEFLAHHQYELTISAAEQNKLADSGGLCDLHTWGYHNTASPLGESIGYPKLLERWRDFLAGLSEEGRITSAIAAQEIEDRLPTERSCAVCQVCRETEIQALDAAADLLRRGGDGAVDHLSALCLRHVAMLARQITDETMLRSLVRRQAGLFERVAEDMRRYAVKREGLRRQLASNAENIAGERGLRLIAGQPNVSFVKRRSIRF